MKRHVLVSTSLGAVLSLSPVVAPVAEASGRPAPGFQCRTTVSDIGTRAGRPQIIDPIRATNVCTGVVRAQSVAVILQWWDPRGPLLPGRWKTVTSRKSSKLGAGRVNISTRWNCGDPHRNDAGRVRLRVVATGLVISAEGDPSGASALSGNEIVRDCAV